MLSAIEGLKIVAPGFDLQPDRREVEEVYVPLARLVHLRAGVTRALHDATGAFLEAGPGYTERAAQVRAQGTGNTGNTGSSRLHRLVKGAVGIDVPGEHVVLDGDPIQFERPLLLFPGWCLQIRPGMIVW